MSPTERQPTPGPDFLRRFLPVPGNPTLVAAAHFRPTPSDTDGISVSLRELANPIRRVLADTRKPPDNYSVCAFNLTDLPDLSVRLSPTERDPGHAAIPEIAPPYDKLREADERKIRIKCWMAELARRARTIHRAGDAIPEPE